MINPHLLCGGCKTELAPGRFPHLFVFSAIDHAVRGKNELCPICGWILWIPTEPAGTAFAVESPVTVLSDPETERDRNRPLIRP